MTIQWCFEHSQFATASGTWCLEGHIQICDVAEMIPVRASDLGTTSGEVWGGFYDGQWKPPTEELEEGQYAGAWYWQYYVWFPKTHIVNHLYNDGEPVKVGGEQ